MKLATAFRPEYAAHSTGRLSSSEQVDAAATQALQASLHESVVRPVYESCSVTQEHSVSHWPARAWADEHVKFEGCSDTFVLATAMQAGGGGGGVCVLVGVHTHACVQLVTKARHVQAGACLPRPT